MKVQWEAADIRPGRVVGKPGRIERWLIGYIGHGGDYALVSLSDGMIGSKMSASDLAASLNQNGEFPAEFGDILACAYLQGGNDTVAVVAKNQSVFNG